MAKARARASARPPPDETTIRMRPDSCSTLPENWRSGSCSSRARQQRENSARTSAESVGTGDQRPGFAGIGPEYERKPQEW
jgi:hypothetical protein